MNPQNLYQYYQSQGQNLPSVQDRAPLYSQHGGQGNYTGTTEQNQFLLSKLSGATNQPAVGSLSAKMDFAKNSYNLQNMLNNLSNQEGIPKEQTESDYLKDPFYKMLSEQQSLNDTTSNALIKNIQSNYIQSKNSLESDYDSYKRGLQLLGIQTNSAQSTPDILMGHIQQAQNEFRSKVNNLKREETMALLDAEQARSDKNVSLLKEKMNYIKDLKRQKIDALKEMYDKMSLEKNISEHQIGMYYDEMQKLNDSEKEDFLIELSRKFNIPMISLTKAIQTEKENRDAKIKKESSTSSESESESEDDIVVDFDTYLGNKSTKKLHKLANELKDKLQISTSINLTRQDEIKQLKEKLPNYIAYLQSEEGLTYTQIKSLLEDYMK